MNPETQVIRWRRIALVGFLSVLAIVITGAVAPEHPAYLPLFLGGLGLFGFVFWPREAH